MNDKNSTLVIERVANGFLVRPLYPPSSYSSPNDVMVFQEKGGTYASGGVDPNSTLFGWLDSHFPTN